MLPTCMSLSNPRHDSTCSGTGMHSPRCGLPEYFGTVPDLGSDLELGQVYVPSKRPAVLVLQPSGVQTLQGIERLIAEAAFLLSVWDTLS